MTSVGAVLPHAHVARNTDILRKFVTGIDGLGFTHINVFDHVLGAEHRDRTPPLSGPYDEHDPFREPMVLFGYLAAISERLQLTTAVLVLPQRQTALVAKQTAEIDLLSNGRLRLGVGVGWNHVEYTSLNEDFNTRGQRVDDQVILLRRLWSESLVRHDTDFHTIERAGIAPRPNRVIPIWFGGFGVAALRRAARLGDGFIFTSLDHARRQVPLLRRLADDADRAGNELGVDILVRLDEPDWREQIEACRKLEASHITFGVHHLADRSTEQLIEYLGQARKHAGIEP